MRKYVQYLSLFLSLNILVLLICTALLMLNLFRSSDLVNWVRVNEFFGNYYLIPLHFIVSIYLLDQRSSRAIGLINLVSLIAVVAIVMAVKEG